MSIHLSKQFLKVKTYVKRINTKVYIEPNPVRFSCKTSSISLFPSPLGTLLSSGPTSARSWEGGRLNSLFPPFCSFCLVSKATTLKTQTHALALDSRDFTITPDKNNEGPKQKKKCSVTCLTIYFPFQNSAN